VQQQLNELQKRLRKLDQKRPLSAIRMAVLQSIGETSPVTVKQLAEQHQVRMPTMSKLLDELQQRGLILRAHAKDDARRRLIILTQKGRQQLQASRQKEVEFWQTIEQQLGAKKWQSLQQNLSQLLIILKQLQ